MMPNNQLATWGIILTGVIILPSKFVEYFGCGRIIILDLVVQVIVVHLLKMVLKVVGVDASAYAMNCVPGVQDNLFFIENNELPLQQGQSTQQFVKRCYLMSNCCIATNFVGIK